MPQRGTKEVHPEDSIHHMEKVAGCVATGKVSKGAPAVMCPCIAWMPHANSYLMVKFITSTLYFAVSRRVQSRTDISISTVTS